MTDPAGARPVPALLLLSGSPDWTRDTVAAAAALGLAAPHITDCAGDVVALLAGGTVFSHLLIHGPTAGALLPDLIGMTAGEAGSDVHAVLLGPDGEAARDASGAGRITVVTRTGEGWLARALAAAARPCHAAEVPLAELTAALAAGGIQARYQPIVRLADRRPVGIEALARLVHPRLGTLPPDRFVPRIEAAGLGCRLAARVIRRALADWRGDRLRRLGLRLGVNVPLDVLLRQGAAERLDRWRAAAGIAAGRIVVELTETRPVDDPPALAGALARLSAAGYGLAIDDVSPDLRHHEELIGMPFHAMKLDRSVVQDPDGSGGFIPGAVAAAHRAGLQVIAEGVEDAATWGRMAAHGVDAAQGFLIARPLTAAAVPIWMAAWRRARGR